MKVKRVINIVLAGVLCVLSVVVPSPHASAASVMVVSATTTDGNTRIPIERKIKNLNVGSYVNAIFTYAITPSPSNPAGALNEPDEVQVVFNDTMASLEDDGLTVSAVASNNIDFAGTTYTTPGDYFYNVIEVDSSNSDFAVDETSSYNLMVSIRNRMQTLDDGTEYTEGDLVATVLATPENELTGEKEDKAVFGALEETRVMFHITTGIGGNAGDLSHCFAYKLEVFAGGGLNDGDTLDIDYDEADADICTGTARVVTVGTPTYVYLTHHQQAFIGIDSFSSMLEVPLGARYRVTNEGDDDYATTANCDQGGMGTVLEFNEGEVRTCGIITITMPTTDQGVSFSHTKTLSALTGVSLKSFPYIVAGIISAVGIFLAAKGFMNIKAKRS